MSKLFLSTDECYLHRHSTDAQGPTQLGPIQSGLRLSFCSLSSILPSVVLQLSEAAVLLSAIVAKNMCFSI